MTSCPECSEPLRKARSGGGFCVACEEFFPFEQLASFTQPQSENIDLWRISKIVPYPLALLLEDYLKEKNLHFKIHRMCDSAEMCTRFLTTICLAEIQRSKGIKQVGASLKYAILKGIEQPTFGKWVGLLREALAELSEDKNLTTPIVREVAMALLEIVSPVNSSRETSLLKLRNDVAHQRFSHKQAEISLGLHGHQDRFEHFWYESGGPLLSSLQLIGFSQVGNGFLLHGVPSCDKEFLLFDMKHLTASDGSWSLGSIILSAKGTSRWIELTPLQIFGPVLRRRDDGSGEPDIVLNEDVLQVYSRRENQRLQYMVLHDKIGAGDGTVALQERFDELFPLNFWRDEIQAEEDAELERKIEVQVQKQLLVEASIYRFRDVVNLEIKRGAFVGRDADIAHVLEWLNQRQTGACVIFGQPGMGKTAFLAHLSIKLARERPNWLCLRHFFRASDNRCSFHAFTRGVVLQLALNGMTKSETPFPQNCEEFVETVKSFVETHIKQGKPFSRLIFLLDGLDEAAQENTAIFDLIKMVQLPGVIWVVTARPELSVRESLVRSTSIDWLFGEEGLASLSETAVRTFLMETLERNRYAILEDEERGGKFLEALTTKARSLPLYLHLLVADLRAEKGQQYIDHPDQLPKDLIAYYDQLMEALSLDAANIVLPHMIALLAIARTPLPEAMIANLLIDHDLRKDQDWSEAFKESFSLGNILIRPGYVQVGVSGQTLYHQTFREYLISNEKRSYRDFKFSPVVRKARERIIRLCLDWNKWPRDSYEYTYSLRYSIKHLVEDERWGDVENLLTDLSFLESQNAAGQIFKLANDYSLAVSEMPPVSPKYPILSLLEEALRKDIHFIAANSQNYPQALFQSLWNSCWWYDCPEAAKHYESGYFGQNESLMLFTQLENWRTVRREKGIGAPWLRSLRPPPIRLGSLRTRVLSGHSSFINLIAVSSDGLQLASGGDDGEIRIWNAATGEQTGICCKHKTPIQALTFVKDSLIASASSEFIRIWNTETMEDVFTLPKGEQSFHGIAVSPDCTHIAIGQIGMGVILNIQTGSTTEFYDTMAYGFSDLCFSPDGNWLASASMNRVLLWDITREIENPPLEISCRGTSSISFSQDCQLVVVASADKTASIWDLETGEQLRVLRGHEHIVNDACFSKDNAFVATCSFDGSVRLWITETGEQKMLLRGHNLSVASVAFDPNGRHIVSGSADGTVRIWEICNTSSTPAPIMYGSQGTIGIFGFSSSGQRLATTASDYKIRIWDTENGCQLLVIQGHSKEIHSLSFSPNEKQIATTSADQGVHIWDTETGKEIRSFHKHSGSVRCIAYHPSGQFIASSSDREVILWNISTGRQMYFYSGKVDYIMFSSDGHFLLSRSPKGIGIRRVDSGVEIFSLSSEEIAAASFSAEDKAVVIEFSNGTIQAWDFQVGRKANGLSSFNAMTAEMTSLNETRITKRQDNVTIARVSMPLFRANFNLSSQTLGGWCGTYLALFALEEM